MTDKPLPERLVESGKRKAAKTREEVRTLAREAGHLLGVPLRLIDAAPGRRIVERRVGPVGAAPGTLIEDPDAPDATASVYHYTPAWCEHRDIERVGPNEAAALRSVARSEGVTWIDVVGVRDASAVGAIGEAFGLHPLVQEDLANTTQRPKLEFYDDQAFVVARMVHPETGAVEQVSFVLGEGYLLTFQEAPGDVFAPVRQRLETDGSRVRGHGADYLLYALLDLLVDGLFATVERLGDATEALEEAVLGNPGDGVRAALAGLRREVIIVRRAAWPLREVVSRLWRDESALVGETARLFLRDVHDHVVQAADALETLRDVIAGTQDLYLSVVSSRQNEVMKALTIVGAVFLPLTFLTGLYGMNFDRMPELHLPYAYPVFLIVLTAVTLLTLVVFRVKRWL